MFKAYTVGRPFGVEIRLHGTLMLLLGLVTIGTLISSGVGAMLSTAMMLAFLIVSVTLHELGHIGAASLFGIGTTGVTLYPFGGIARLERDAKTPLEELVVALAGPAVNVVLAGLAAIPLFLLGPVEPVMTFIGVNVVLALFNLVPAYPMDGGRVLRGALWTFIGRHRGTRLAARFGQVFAVIFALLGLFWSPMLLLIGGLIFFQASGELKRLDLLKQVREQAARPQPELDAWGRPRAFRHRPRVLDEQPGGSSFTADRWEELRRHARRS